MIPDPWSAFAAASEPARPDDPQPVELDLIVAEGAARVGQAKHAEEDK